MEYPARPPPNPPPPVERTVSTPALQTRAARDPLDLLNETGCTIRQDLEIVSLKGHSEETDRPPEHPCCRGQRTAAVGRGSDGAAPPPRELGMPTTVRAEYQRYRMKRRCTSRASPLLLVEAPPPNLFSKSRWGAKPTEWCETGTSKYIRGRLKPWARTSSMRRAASMWDPTYEAMNFAEPTASPGDSTTNASSNPSLSPSYDPTL